MSHHFSLAILNATQSRVIHQLLHEMQKHGKLHIDWKIPEIPDNPFRDAPGFDIHYDNTHFHIEYYGEANSIKCGDHIFSDVESLVAMLNSIAL